MIYSLFGLRKNSIIKELLVEIELIYAIRKNMNLRYIELEGFAVID